MKYRVVHVFIFFDRQMNETPKFTQCHREPKPATATATATATKQRIHFVGFT